MFEKLFRKERDTGDPIANAHAQYLESTQARARNLAPRLSKLSNSSIENCIAPTRAQYFGLASQQIRPLAGDAGALAQSDKEHLEELRRRAEAREERLHEKERMLVLQREQLPHKRYKSRNRKLLYLVIVLLAIGDALVTRPALAIFMSDSNLSQMLLLVVLTAIFVMVPHGIVGTFRASENSKYKHAIRIVAFVVLIFGLSIIGILRSVFLQHIGSTTMQDVQAASTVEMKVWWMVSLNLFFLFSSTYAVYLLGTNDENESLDQVQEIDRQLNEVRAEMRECESELKSIPNRILNSERQWSQRQADINNLKARIGALFMEAASAFVSECVLYVTDPDIDLSFLNEPVRPLF